MVRFPSPLLLATLVPIAGCVAYESADIDLSTLAATTPALPPGELTFGDAVAFALRHNPELAQLAAEARAAGADVPATEVEVAWEGADDMLAVMVDPIALLGLGQRGASIDAAAARELEALEALAVARWRLIGQIAEVYAATAALAAVTVPGFPQDPEPFVRAGLASPVAAAIARGAAASAEAERLALDAERAGLLAELRPLLGLMPQAPLVLAPVDADFPPLPAPDDQRLLQRPDLALAIARYQVADAEFRSAVAEQYPSLQIGPDIPLRGGALDVAAVLRLPVGASSRALAAKERRAATRAMVHAALLAVSNDADAAIRRHQAAAQRAVATTTSAGASAMALAAAEAALAVEVDAFDRLAERGQMAMRDAMEQREAVIAGARSRVQQALAWGWPATEGRR